MCRLPSDVPTVGSTSFQPLSKLRSTATMTRWSNEDALVVLADLAYIAGSIRGDKQLLLQALAAYDACYFCLDRVPTSGNVMHMRAETLLRLQRPAAACDAFARVYAHTLGAAHAELDVAPFRLIHDAEALGHAVRCGADVALLERARRWRRLAGLLEESVPPSRSSEARCPSTGVAKACVRHMSEVRHAAALLRRTRLCDLSADEHALLGDKYGEPLPLPPRPPTESSSVAADTMTMTRFDHGFWRHTVPILAPQQ